ncbi:MAG: MATE family efflux transporter [Clostridiales Family XIII bacterium]|nr:MATE family efflux transporter [Clostridiales Family XIII bacterium]
MDNNSNHNDANPDASERLGSEPIGRLLLDFSMPAITGMVVNSLYNIIDRIFVGHAVGEMALGGLALVLPLMTIFMAFAVLFGMGAANMISIRLGQQQHEAAESAMNHCFWLLLLSGVLVAFIGPVFMEPLLLLSGGIAGSESIDYAREFMNVYMRGSVFSLFSLGFSHCTRAQGFPGISLIAMLIGGCVNVCLVPLFLFVFHWGVTGAALGTILAQACSSIFLLIFNFSPKASLRIHPFSFRPSIRTVLSLLSFGAAQFIYQLITTLVLVIYNSSMSKYGPEAIGVPEGGDIALSAMNIIMSLLLLIQMPIFGISQGAQPLLGYNHGAEKYQRVIDIFKRAAIVGTCIACAGFLLMEIFSPQIVTLFAPDGSNELLTFTPIAMRFITITMPLLGFHIVASNMFIATGRIKIAILLPALRQFLLLIPMIMVLGKFWGMTGVVVAGPISDILSFVLVVILIRKEFKKLHAKINDNI